MKRCLVALHAVLVLLAGCTSELDGGAVAPKGSVAVSVHGVNYSGDPFNFGVTQPNAGEDTGVGEHIGPFSAGGTVCCFNLPEKWKPGIKLTVYASHWVGKGANNGADTIDKVHTVELPPYADGKAGELWVMRTAEGGLDVVSSDLQPDHPQWPGKVKGWPEPSLEYRRGRWALLHKNATDYLENYENSLKELEENSERTLKEFWESDKKYEPDEVKHFSGPDDPRYIEHLKTRLKEGLQRSQARVRQSLKEKP
ncbi:DUF3304 domain-containing protein [Massilia sp. DD77]|uniref:DUF3304 domain-containing protein n=1 Tax=Massilia sp. DD77 TaxID=3109349 RepID=UPI0030000079